MDGSAGITSTTAITTVPRCYNVNGSPVVVAANTVLVQPWYPEGIYWPSPQQGQLNWAKNLSQNVNPDQQPGLL